MYFYGEGVPKDYIEAAKWYRKAAEQGLSPAQGMLGAMYAEGKGVPKDEIEGLAWLNIAAAAGGAQAVKNRGIIENRLGRAATLSAQRRSREILKEIEAAKTSDAIPKEHASETEKYHKKPTGKGPTSVSLPVDLMSEEEIIRAINKKRSSQ